MKFIQRIVIFAQVTQATSDTESKTLSLDRGVTKDSVLNCTFLLYKILFST
ncbi:MAG: hypothetical protein CLLPBCKN_001937 [Chroococcidiopsis cubana SAG 39.79]|nr:hypothetical protein [Chroococcidiopsis cubana SAG 39.79]